MSNLTKEQVNALADDIRSALKNIADKHGMSFAMAGGTYSEDTLKLGKVQFTLNSVAGEVNPILFTDMKRYGGYHGLSIDLINKEVQLDGKTVIVLGMRGRNSVIWKYQNNGDSRYKTDAKIFKARMKV